MNSGKRVLLLILEITAAAFLASVLGWSVLAQEGGWTTPTVVSAPSEISWFPDLAVDPFGTVHVIWCLTTPLGGIRGLQEQVNYTHWSGESWSEPNDIVPPSADIVRNAIATDLSGNVHLLFGGSVYDGFTLYHQRAPAGEAWSAGAWSAPHRINQGISYMGDMAIDSQGVIHVVYDDTIRRGGEDELVLSDIFYRRSSDNGRTWSVPVRLYSEPLLGSARPYVKVDRNDVIHVTWDEGWDRLTPTRNDTYYGVYVSSSDGGETWTLPTVIDHPDETTAQLTMGSDGQGGVMLVWRSMSQDELFYQWSADNGLTWGAPSVVTQIFARLWTTPFDMYDMATDSAGHIHLLVVGRRFQDTDALLGIYHLVWDGDSWSNPIRIFAETGLLPEYPKIVIHEGNQLHIAWFTREGDVWDVEANREVWYSSGQSPSPHQAVVPWPTFTPESPTATPRPTPTVTPYPTVSFEDTGLPDGLHTEGDDVFRLIVALLPVALVILAAAAVKTRWFGRLRR